MWENGTAAYAKPKLLCYNVPSAKEKQAAAKQTFVFLARETSKGPMKSDRERVSAGLRVT